MRFSMAARIDVLALGVNRTRPVSGAVQIAAQFFLLDPLIYEHTNPSPGLVYLGIILKIRAVVRMERFSRHEKESWG